MGILEALIQVRGPKPYIEEKRVASITVASKDAWYANIQYSHNRHAKFRLDIPIGGELTKEEIKEAPERLMRKENGATMRFEEIKMKCAIVSFEDGTNEIRDLSFCDQDLPLGLSLEPELCQTVHKVEDVSGKIVLYKRVKELHYKGLDFVTKWTISSEKSLIDVFPEESIENIQLVPGNYGLDALIKYKDGNEKSYSLDYRSVDVDNGQVVSPQRCTLVKMRKYHTLKKEFILVK